VGPVTDWIMTKFAGLRHNKDTSNYVLRKGRHPRTTGKVRPSHECLGRLNVGVRPGAKCNGTRVRRGRFSARVQSVNKKSAFEIASRNK